MSARSKVKANKIREIRARINELDRARPYIGNTKFYWGRRNDLEEELKEVCRNVSKEDGIPMRTEEEIVQYLVIYD